MDRSEKLKSKQKNIQQGNIETLAKAIYNATKEFTADLPRFVGSYSDSGIYSKNNVVEHDGSSYISLTDNNTSLIDSDEWRLLALKGEKGKDAEIRVNKNLVEYRVGDDWQLLLDIKTLKGEKGDTGASGRDGIDGAPGLKGERGEKGEPGSPGSMPELDFRVHDGYMEYREGEDWKRIFDLRVLLAYMPRGGGSGGGTTTSTPGIWGQITGTLADQTDLQTALDGKLDDSQISDVAYDATTWNGNTDAPTKNAVRDKFESFTPTIPTRNNFTTNFEGSGRWINQNAGTSSAVTYNTTGILLNKGTDTTGSASVSSNNMPYSALVYDKNPVFWVEMANNGVTASNTWDLYANIDVLGTSSITATRKHIGFANTNTDGVQSLSGTNGNGSTQTLTTLTGAGTNLNGNREQLVAKMTSGTDVKFYIRNVLKGTSTTNLPSGNLAIGWWGGIIKASAGTAEQSAYLYTLGFSWEIDT